MAYHLAPSRWRRYCGLSRQPTERQAVEHLASIERRISDAREVVPMRAAPLSGVSEKVDGFYITPKRHRHGDFVVLPSSDVSLRCFDCARVILDHRDNAGCYAPRCLCRDRLYKIRFECGCPDSLSFRVCVSCGNKRRAADRVNRLWNEGRVLVKTTERKLYEHRKNSRGTTQLSPGTDEQRSVGKNLV